MQFAPHDYQRRAGEFALENKRAALFLDMGLGKTVIMLTVLLRLLERGVIRGALVVAPLRVLGVWSREAQKWDHLRGLRFSAAHGSGKSAALDRRTDIYLVNYDGLVWLRQEVAARGGRVPFDCLVLDESTHIKAPDTSRWKAVKKMLPLFTRRYIMTATPIPNSLLDLWTQAYVLDDGERLGGSFFAYRNKFFTKADYHGYRWKEKPGAARLLNRLVAPIAMRLKAEDWLAMPEKLVVTHEVDLPEDVRELYVRMEREFLVEVAGGRVTAANAAVASSKLRQICQGLLLSGEVGQKVHHLHNMKVEELLSIIEGCNEPVLVAIQFRAEAKVVLDAMPQGLVSGGAVGVIMGGVSTATSESLIDRWNRGELKVLIANPGTLAEGVNLQAGGRRLVWLAPTWSLNECEQLEGRLYRQGQKKTVFIHRIVVKDTVDEVVYQALERKGDGQQRLLAAIEQYRNRGGHDAA